LIRAYPVHPTCPIAGSFSPGPGPAGRTRRTVSTGGELNPMHSGQNPLHLYAGSPGLRARSIERSGRALILAYPVHPICPVAGSFSPDPELRRQDQAYREDRRRIEPHAPVRRAAPVMATLRQIVRAAREGRVDSPARAQAVCRIGERRPSGRAPASQVLRIIAAETEYDPMHQCAGGPGARPERISDRTPCTCTRMVPARGPGLAPGRSSGGRLR
jgi:hypothetical protein